MKSEVLSFLKKKITQMNKTSKFVVILFDEITRDCIDGVVDVNVKRTRQFANEAHFFMIRGLFENYKYAFSFNLS